MSSDLHAAPWWQQGVIYQIYPRSFQDSNADGIGDLRGIISRLDYLNDGTEKSLGVDAIWLSPCYPSPMSDFGYDISDYTDIDPLFGTLQDFHELLQEAHRRGIKVIMDLVINHTSDQHPWFIESRASKASDKRDWYIWHAGNKGKPPNNWFAGFELKSAWWRDETTQEFYLATFTRHQPEVNWRNAQLKEAMFAVIRFWLEMGVDGYRMDTVNWYLKDELWRNNPWHLQLNPPDLQRHIYDRNRPETHGLCRDIRRLLDSYSERMLVGEIFCDDARLAAEYYGKSDELHLAFNFAFLFQPWSAKHFHHKIVEWENLLPTGCWPNYTLSNHDQPRHYTRYAQGTWSEPRARVAAALLLTLRGTPFLYYGEEIGMANRHIARRELQDPMGKKLWPLLPGRDGARTPMQWDSSPHGGFSFAKPWLPLNPDYPVKNVVGQAGDAQSLFSFYRRLLWLRKKTPALLLGEYRSFATTPHDFLAYQRSYNGESVSVLLNFTRRRLRIHLPQLPTGRVLLSTHRGEGEKVDTAHMELQAYEVLLLA